jgi:uncharacterized protein
MEIIIKDLAEGQNQIAFQETQESLRLKPSELFLMRPVEVRVSVLRSKDKLTFYGRITALAEPECARCLKLFPNTLEAEIRFILDSSEAAGGTEIQDDDYEFVSKTVASYDMTNRIREALLLNLPMRFLCSPDCKGLCPTCGTNLNTRECNCQKEEIDPRWEKLKRVTVKPKE